MADENPPFAFVRVSLLLIDTHVNLCYNTNILKVKEGK